jgi:hypothetical protein
MITHEQFPSRCDLIGYSFRGLQSDAAPTVLTIETLFDYASPHGSARVEPFCYALADNDDAARSERSRYGAEVCHFLATMTLREDDCA